MHSNIQTIQSIQVSTPLATTPIDNDTAIISEGLLAIALPLGLFLGVLTRKTQKRRLLKRQIALLERLWQLSVDRAK